MDVLKIELNRGINFYVGIVVLTTLFAAAFVALGYIFR
jgi:hypothetical protein